MIEAALNILFKNEKDQTIVSSSGVDNHPTEIGLLECSVSAP